MIIVSNLLSVTVVHGQHGSGVTYSSTHICAPKGSTVDIPCTYTYPPRWNECDVVAASWFREMNGNDPVDLRSDSDYTGRVEYHFYVNGCTLRIKDLRESDSAEYKFTLRTNKPDQSLTGSPGVSLSVTALQVRVTKIDLYAVTAELKCHSSCSPAGQLSYIWFKSGEKIQKETSSVSVSLDTEHSYACALKGHEDSPSPSVSMQVQVTSVTVHQDYTEAVLRCHHSCPPAGDISYIWFKNGKEIQNEEKSSHEDRFYPGDFISCAVRGLEKSVSPSVYALKAPSVSVSPPGGITNGSSVTLKCSSDANREANYTWLKRNQSLPSEEPQLVFTSIQPSDSGEYRCTAENELGKRTSEPVFIDVKYAPQLPSVSVSPSGEIVEGSSVNLTCSSDANPAANYTWYKENEDSPKASGPVFTITESRAEHSGNYYCEAHNGIGRQNSTLFLIVVSVPKTGNKVELGILNWEAGYA
ncbi:B-cell receptor CD22-like [Notolabrus celidotus]|uniref:B-cell receptor CD22-like n=1 Tax=Notolabrus celidotus TaxID=1203425 RepID=UPI00149066BA|nr:B-cell receptor CD22-like [Notolabrus celidotus]